MMYRICPFLKFFFCQLLKPLGPKANVPGILIAQIKGISKSFYVSPMLAVRWGYLNVEPEMHDVTFRQQVSFAFQPELSRLLCGLLTTQ